jgi:very-short-patch-repair endonuclease
LRLTSTDAERKLWSVLRARQLQGYKFRRQYPFGPFILDFACIEHRLAVEADGSQHADMRAPYGVDRESRMAGDPLLEQ